MSLREFKDYFTKNKELFKSGAATRSECVNAGWYDWFCKDASLSRKTYTLGTKVLQLMKSPKLNIDTTYVFFKNNCPCAGKRYDSFSFCSMLDENSGPLFYVAPKIGYNNAELWNKALVAYPGNWEGDLFENWKGVKKFFGA